MPSYSDKKASFFGVLGAVIVAVAFGGFYLSQNSSGNPSTQTTSGSSGSAASTDQMSSNNQPASTTPDYSVQIPTPEVVKGFADGLQIGVNQSDPSRGIGFPSVNSSVDFWSASYGKLILLVYPDKTSLDSDSAAFQKDFDSYSQLFSNSNYTWTSCVNVMAVYPSTESDQISKILASWCNFASPTPSVGASTQQDTSSSGKNQNYILGYNTIINSTVGQLQANNFYAFLSPAGGISKNSATNWCSQISTRIIGLMNQVGDAQGVSDWVSGCVVAATKLARS